MGGIETWLASHGLSHLSEVMRENEVDEEALRFLTDEDLKELGLPLGTWVKLRRAIEQLKDGDAVTDAPAAEAEKPAPEGSREAERRQLTVMFVDLAGSTELTGRLDPEDARETITAYQNTVAAGVARYRGEVAKYMGDGVLCYFGWPQAREDDPERAIRAGLDIVGHVLGGWGNSLSEAA
jgi:class 3 adenylate cyclase